MKKNVFNCISGILIFSLIFPITIYAGEVKLNLGVWIGEKTPELEKRFFLDDLTAAPSRINMPWSDLSTIAFYPVGIEYHVKSGSNTIIGGVNYNKTSKNISYNGIDTGAISMITLENFAVSDIEIYAGYRIQVSPVLSLTPRVGGINHIENFTYNEKTIGNGAAAISIDENGWESSSRGTFVGAEAKYVIADKLSLFADILLSPPIFADMGGTMEAKRTVVGGSGAGPTVYIDNIQSGYRIDQRRFTLGAEYEINNNLFVQFGLRKEDIITSYPDYFNFPIVFNGGKGFGPGFSGISEFITDLLLYEIEIKSTKGILFASVTLSM